jgi:hypothetical protein
MCSSFKAFPLAIACCFIATCCADFVSHDINDQVCCVSVNSLDTKTTCSRWRKAMTEYGLKTVNCKHTKTTQDDFIHGCSPTIIDYNDNVKIHTKYSSAAKWKDTKCNIIAHVDYDGLDDKAQKVTQLFGTLLIFAFLKSLNIILGNK